MADRMTEHDRYVSRILTQLPNTMDFPIVDRAQLLEQIEAHEHERIHVDKNNETTLKEACEACKDDSCFPLTCKEDVAELIAKATKKEDE